MRVMACDSMARALSAEAVILYAFSTTKHQIICAKIVRVSLVVDNVAIIIRKKTLNVISLHGIRLGIEIFQALSLSYLFYVVG